MQYPFNHENYPSNELKRNTFPCSFQNNLTMKYGYIYPAGIWRTVPGATYKIKPTLGLNFMPTTFPVQTRQKVYVHYFYGRDRNFWKDYKDFVNGQRPDLVKPYIDESVTQARTGKLLDYLGVPTTLVGSYGRTVEEFTDEVDTNYLCIESMDFNTGEYTGTGSSSVVQPVDYDSLFTALNNLLGENLSLGRSNTINNVFRPLSFNMLDNSNFIVTFNTYTQNGSLRDFSEVPPSEDVASNGNTFIFASPTPISKCAFGSFFRLVCTDSTGTVLSILTPTISDTNLVFNINGFNKNYNYYLFSPRTVVFLYQYLSGNNSVYRYQITYRFTYPVKYSYSQNLSEVVDIDSTSSPYWCSNDLRGKETIKLNAYLPRFYETVYNLYYRNPQNNPYILDGRPEYNKFIPSKDGGVDSNLYELRRRNWEDDFLTTSVQSPQQGIAPLVGLTDRGATLTLTNEDGTVTRYNVTTTENGSISGIEANDTSAEPVLTKALIDAVSYGISIEDIRNVNAMQKWLELNLRKGYQYKDIIQARWGISISYNELDLPEFIGGFSKDVQLQAVTQTANVSDDVTGQLGWQAGRLYASGEGREITHYCDEEGFIMCLITVVPVPNYSQLLPKHWFERDLLDSYQPEFNHIGFQPITYKEVCPVQAFQESSENVNVLEQTFGYQRPWYQYFNYTDEVHGQFRTTFKDFLINRVFDVKPELSESFLLVDPEQINDVFNVPDVEDDKIIGAIYHNCVAKLPISLYAQARIE